MEPKYTRMHYKNLATGRQVIMEHKIDFRMSSDLSQVLHKIMTFINGT